MTDPHEITSRELFARLPADQIEHVFSGTASCEIDPEFLGFVGIYKNLSEIIPKHFTVIDLGCAYAPQAFYFEDHKAYIGVDAGARRRFSADNTTHYTETIQSFIARREHEAPCFAICSYVPNWHGFKKSMIGEAFEDCFVFYPKGSPKKALEARA